MEDYKGVTLVFDIDGTICPIKAKDEKYEDMIPYESIIKKIKQYHEAGAKIILYTSRNMKTYGGNIGLINKNTAPIIIEWLKKWGIPYDEIYFGKVWPGEKGFYIDDRSIRPDEFMNMNVEQLSALCEKSRNNVKEA